MKYSKEEIELVQKLTPEQKKAVIAYLQDLVYKQSLEQSSPA